MRPICPHRLLLIAALLVPAGVPATAYKWVDEAGNVHYTQSPPPGRPAERIGPPPPPADPEDARRRVEERIERADEYLEQRRKEREERLAAEREAEERLLECEQARENLQQLQMVQRPFEVTDSGERVRMSEEQRQAAIERARQRVEEFCD